jgi:hypothetical protein
VLRTRLHAKSTTAQLLLTPDHARALRWRLDKACGRIEAKREAEAKRASRAAASVGGGRLFALAPAWHLLAESHVQSESKVVVLATGLQQHPCRALSALSRAVLDAVPAVGFTFSKVSSIVPLCCKYTALGNDF